MSALPPITLSDRDLARLEALLESPAVAALPVARALSDELARANVVPAAAVPADVVTMNAAVTCVEETSGVDRTGDVKFDARHLQALLHRMVRNAEIRGDFLGRLMLKPLPQANLLALRQSRKGIAVAHLINR